MKLGKAAVNVGKIVIRNYVRHSKAIHWTRPFTARRVTKNMLRKLRFVRSRTALRRQFFVGRGAFEFAKVIKKLSFQITPTSSEQSSIVTCKRNNEVYRLLFYCCLIFSCYTLLHLLLCSWLFVFLPCWSCCVQLCFHCFWHAYRCSKC